MMLSFLIPKDSSNLYEMNINIQNKRQLQFRVAHIKINFTF